MQTPQPSQRSGPLQTLHPLKSAAPVIVYLDIKSPYAYLAVEPTRQLEKEMGVSFDWRPFVLDIPSYLGSARLGEHDEVLEQQRSDEQWAAVKHAYFDCRRYARLQNKTIRGTVKIWDTNLVSTAMFWLREHHPTLLARFIDRVYAPFWIRELDVEREDVIANLLREVGVDGLEFLAWSRHGGLQETTDFQERAFEQGIYGVPTYVVGGEVLFGREHLPRVRWHFEGASVSGPDIAYTVPDILPSSLHKPILPPSRVVVGLDNSLDSLLALPALLSLLQSFTGELHWIELPAKSYLALPRESDPSRSERHKRLRLQNWQANLARYAPLDFLGEDIRQETNAVLERLSEASVGDMASSRIGEFLRQHHLVLEDHMPGDSFDPPMSGVAVMLDDELFIGREHLPLIERRLRAVGAP
ncbi:MAG: DsbA family protein [Congregibacter sp.]